MNKNITVAILSVLAHLTSSAMLEQKIYSVTYNESNKTIVAHAIKQLPSKTVITIVTKMIDTNNYIPRTKIKRRNSQICRNFTFVEEPEFTILKDKIDSFESEELSKIILAKKLCITRKKLGVMRKKLELTINTD